MKVTIGPAAPGPWSVVRARRRAKELLGEVAAGVTPMPRRQPQRRIRPSSPPSLEGVDYDGFEDIELGKRRQAALNALAAKSAAAAGIAYQLIVEDGIVGPSSLAAARRQGFRRWRDVPA